MKLTFQKIKYSNILSVGAQSIELDLQSDKKILVTGSNGAGKSTLLEAITFCLFGKTFRPIKKNQLINCINKKKLLVELWFSDGKNDYHIRRGIKPNVFDVTRNGEVIEESSSVKDFQMYVETNILKMSFATFKQVVVLGTAGYQPFMQLPAAQRRAMIEDIINLSVYSKMDQVNKTALKTMKINMDQIELKLEGIKREYDAHMFHIQKQQNMSDDYIKQEEDRIQHCMASIKTTTDEIAALNDQAANISLGIDQRPSYDKCIAAISAINSKLGGIAQQQRFFHDHSHCPTCKQGITEKHSDSIIAGLDTEERELREKMTKVDAMKNDFSRMMEEFNTQLMKTRKIMEEINQKQYRIHCDNNEINACNNRIARTKAESTVDTSKVDELVESMKLLRDEKTDLFDDMYARKIVLNMLKDSGIKALVMKKYMPMINSSINHYLRILGSDCVFTLDQEFNEIIKSRGREDFSYTSFSQGERARIDLALLFTWRKIASVVSGTDISLLILDEVSDSATDAEGVRSLHKILDDMNSTSLIISHREEHDSNLFNKHIKMSKPGRFTVMS